MHQPAVVLVVEDDPRMGRLVQRTLMEDGHRAHLASDGDEALAKIEALAPDAVVLDVMLPRRDGLSICQHLRQRGNLVPILMLTARDTVADRVKGLGAGADDYLVKPFALDELVARVRALLRRGALAATRKRVIQVDDLRLDLDSHEVHRGEEAIALTTREFQLLAYLLRHQGRVLTRAQILDEVWTDAPGANPTIVDIYVHYVRSKIARSPARSLIQTVRGTGYMIKA